MRKIIFNFLLLVSLIEIVSLVYLNLRKSPIKVLGSSIHFTPIPSPSASATPLPTPSASPSPTRSPTPTPTSLPLPTFTSAQINGFIDDYSGKYGLDPNVVRHLALCESGFNPNAVNGQYVGLFQFAVTTWTNLRKELAKDTNINLRRSADESVQTAAYALSKGKIGIWPHCTP